MRSPGSKTIGTRIFIIAVTAAAALLLGHQLSDRDPPRQIGNVIFLHPDGTALNHWQAARIYWKGPDGILEYDQLPEMAVYRGHMADQLTGTSNGGATSHAFGVKVQGPDSYGRDRGRPILALSGYPGSLLREAGCHGHPIGVINDGDIAGEPGTGAFLAETDTRGEPNEQTRQLLEGRPGFEDGDCDPRTDAVENAGRGDRLPDVILGGGERFFLPIGTPLCRELSPQPPADVLPLTCAAHTDAVTGAGPTRDDERNLLELADALGYVIMRTRAELEQVAAQVAADPAYAPRLLGLFAADDLFNDSREEALIEAGLLRQPEHPLPGGGLDYGADKIGRLVIWGQRLGQHGPDDPNYSADPPTAAEMTALGLEVLKRRAAQAGKPFAAVIEVESTDNLPNSNNAIGALRALKRADDTIGVARAFVQTRDPETLLLTAADSDGSGLQLLSLPPAEGAMPGAISVAIQNAIPDAIPETPTIAVNSFFTETGQILDFQVATDGIEGANTRAFVAEPDAQLPFRPLPNQATDRQPVPAQPLLFAIAWPGFSDFAGGILSRAEGLNAHWLGAAEPLVAGEPPLRERFDNTDVYRLLYKTLFGVSLPNSLGMETVTRGSAASAD
ncbi:alkaline phosphatase [Halochromatium sp.]